LHFWLTAAGGIGLVSGLYILMGGNTGIEPLVAVSSIAFFCAMLLFAWIALPILWKVDNVAASMPPREGMAS
jgi:hypothetical protein